LELGISELRGVAVDESNVIEFIFSNLCLTVGIQYQEPFVAKYEKPEQAELFAFDYANDENELHTFKFRDYKGLLKEDPEKLKLMKSLRKTDKERYNQLKVQYGFDYCW
jgi:hypothetical protein